MNDILKEQLIKDLEYILEVMKSGRTQKAYDLLEHTKNAIDFK